MRCCSLEPFCYCRRLERVDDDFVTRRYHNRNYKMRNLTPEEERDLQEELHVAMIDYAARVRRTRRLRAIGMAFVVAIATIVMLLAGCDPRDGYVEPSPSLPTPTIMYTVILPQGGIYDNN